jgi:ribosomal protein S21
MNKESLNEAIRQYKYQCEKWLHKKNMKLQDGYKKN